MFDLAQYYNNFQKDEYHISGLFQTSFGPRVNINCGKHVMETCADCTLGRGKSGCLKGDCHWDDRNATCVENSN